MDLPTEAVEPGVLDQPGRPVVVDQMDVVLAVHGDIGLALDLGGLVRIFEDPFPGRFAGQDQPAEGAPVLGRLDVADIGAADGIQGQGDPGSVDPQVLGHPGVAVETVIGHPAPGQAPAGRVGYVGAARAVQDQGGGLLSGARIPGYDLQGPAAQLPQPVGQPVGPGVGKVGPAGVVQGQVRVAAGIALVQKPVVPGRTVVIGVFKADVGHVVMDYVGVDGGVHRDLGVHPHAVGGIHETALPLRPGASGKKEPGRR